MRHSTIDLTMNVYTDPKLLDVAGAVESLPALPLGCRKIGKLTRHESPQVQRAPTIRRLPGLHQSLHQPPANRAYWGQFWTRRPTTGGKAEAGAVAVSAYPVKEKPADNGCQRANARASEGS